MNLLMLVIGVLTVMVPGFLSSLIVFPRPGDLDFWKRVGVSFGLGILVLVYLGFVLANARLLLFRPFFASLLISCGILSFFAFVRGGFRVVTYYLRYLPFFRPKPVVLKCSHCGATFANERELELHRTTRHPAPRFTCPRCGTVLETEEGLRAHLTVCKVRICPYCGASNPAGTQKCSSCGAWLFT